MLRRAAQRMAELIREGVAPGLAAAIAAEAAGLEPGMVAAECAAIRAEVEAQRRHELGQLTDEQARDHLREHLATRTDINRDLRRVAGKVFYEVMRAGRGASNISEVFLEHADHLDPEQSLQVQYLLLQLWRSLPPGYDPRTPMRTPITRASFMWPELEMSAFYRWIPNG